jgi:hypothetical protein
METFEQWCKRMQEEHDQWISSPEGQIWIKG